jgi:hypothetical protein
MPARSCHRHRRGTDRLGQLFWTSQPPKRHSYPDICLRNATLPVSLPKPPSLYRLPNERRGCVLLFPSLLVELSAFPSTIAIRVHPQNLQRKIRAAACLWSQEKRQEAEAWNA